MWINWILCRAGEHGGGAKYGVGPCVQRELVEVPTFELGMERAALLERNTVTGLQANSEAKRAGMREGSHRQHVPLLG